MDTTQTQTTQHARNEKAPMIAPNGDHLHPVACTCGRRFGNRKGLANHVRAQKS